MDVPRLARASSAFWRVGSVAAIYSAYACSRQAAGPDETPRIDAQSTCRALGARCCTRAWPIPVRPVTPSTLSVALANRRRACRVAISADQARVAQRCLIMPLVRLTSWFDRWGHLSVPTCLSDEHRAQGPARLARQGHRLGRLGLAGASTVLRWRWSGTSAEMIATMTFSPCRRCRRRSRFGPSIVLTAHHHGPGDARQLVGLRHHRDIDGPPFQQPGKPGR